MLEIILGIVGIGFIAKVANEDEKLSPVICGALALVAIVACMALVPIPFLRVLAGVIVAFAIMMAYKAKAGA